MVKGVKVQTSLGQRRGRIIIIMLEFRGLVEYNISMQELRKLQDEDSSIHSLRKTRPVEQGGLWYHLWTPRQQCEKTVKQLLLPKLYHKIMCKLAHAVPLVRHLGRDKTADRITPRFYWLTLFHDVVSIVAGTQIARELPVETNIECFLSPCPL